jgi:hypothetical protein
MIQFCQEYSRLGRRLYQRSASNIAIMFLFCLHVVLDTGALSDSVTDPRQALKLEA